MPNHARIAPGQKLHLLLKGDLDLSLLLGVKFPKLMLMHLEHDCGLELLLVLKRVAGDLSFVFLALGVVYRKFPHEVVARITVL